MEKVYFVSLLLVGIASGWGQTATSAVAETPKGPLEVYTAAAPFYDLSDPALKPWHLRASYQLYDMLGRPAERGTWEYWWASPKVHRASWVRDGVAVTEWSTADGALYRKETGGALRYFERNIAESVVLPLPERRNLASPRMKLDLQMVPDGQENLACVVAAPQGVASGASELPGAGPATYYCFDPATHALRMSSSSQMTKRFGDVVKTQGRFQARQIEVIVGKQTAFTAAVEAVEAMDAADAVLTPAADAVRSQEAVDHRSDNPGGKVQMGGLEKRAQPKYPQIARIKREQGVAVLAGVIGTDGKIHDLEVLAAPSRRLGESALDAVEKWEYRPYLLDGKPVEVETVVNVIFRMEE